MGNDDRLMARVTVTTAIVALIVAAILTVCFDWVAGANLAVGCALGLGSLVVLHRAVMAMGAKTGPGEVQKLTGLALLQVGKFLVLAIALFALFATGKANMLALAAGVTLPTLVLCLKEAGRRIGGAAGSDRGQASVGDEPDAD